MTEIAILTIARVRVPVRILRRSRAWVVVEPLVGDHAPRRVACGRLVTIQPADRLWHPWLAQLTSGAGEEVSDGPA